MDQVAARKLEGRASFASLELCCGEGVPGGSCGNAYSCAYSHSISRRTPGSPMSPEIAPAPGESLGDVTGWNTCPISDLSSGAPMRFLDRVIACYQALATGDAIGKQTETLSRAGVASWYPEGITGFHGLPGDVIPRYIGKRYEWRIGETTDDTEQSLAVTRALLREPRACHHAVGKELLECRKSLHPGVSLWSFVELGDPSRIASVGDGCGAAMRVAPVGVLFPSNRLDELARAACECSIPTHGGSAAICAAAAVAGAVSAALEGWPTAAVLGLAIAASNQAERLRPRGQPPSVAESIERVHADLAASKHLDPDRIAVRYFPGNPHHVVPLAIALALVTRSARQTALLAANIGGDSDSVASIGGAIAGALHPETVDAEWFDVVRRVNNDGLLAAAAALAALRLRS